MKKFVLVGLLATSIWQFGQAQSVEIKAIKSTITAFADAGDRNDADQLATYLAADYRIVMNRLFGSDALSVMPAQLYLDKIRSGEFGGDTRRVKVKKVLVNGTTATAKVIFMGQKMTVISLIGLAKGSDGQWRLVSDTPMIQ